MTRATNVLVVDDNPGFNHAARTVLGNDGFLVHTAETGHEALAFLERRPPFKDAPSSSIFISPTWTRPRCCAACTMTRACRRSPCSS